MSDIDERGHYQRIDNGQLVEARYLRVADGRWHGSLWIDSWRVKEAYLDSREAISDWCFDAWIELVVEEKA